MRQTKKTSNPPTRPHTSRCGCWGPALHRTPPIPLQPLYAPPSEPPSTIAPFTRQGTLQSDPSQCRVAVPTSAVVGDDLFRLPFSPSSGCYDATQAVTWDLRAGAHVKLLGGPYEGDVGTVVARDEEGHYRIRFADSVNPELNMMRRPFSLWLGGWWVGTLAEGRTVCPGAPLPFLNVTPEEFDGVREAKQRQVRSAIDAGKYARMLKAGVPREAVEARMKADGVTVALPPDSPGAE